MSVFPLINKFARGGTDPCSHLRFSIETMPGARGHRFTPSTRAEIISELYHSLWGSYAHLFVPNSNSSLPMHALLSDVQIRSGFFGASKDDQVVPGKSCGHIFKKGQCCYRCKDCALDDSCVMCSRCFHATNHEGHNVTFYIAQQSGGCCDCGDAEAWRQPIGCPLHSPFNPDVDPVAETAAKRAAARNIAGESTRSLFSFNSVPGSPPADLRESMSKTVAYALDFILDTLDYSPDETTPVPSTEEELKTQPSASPVPQDLYAIILWNDEKHAFEEVIQLICDLTDRTREQAAVITETIDENGREIIDMSQNTAGLLEMARTINQIDLGVTVRRAFDTFREQIAVIMIEWLLDLTRARMSGNTLILREIVATELLNPRGKTFRPPISGNGVAKIHAELKDPARLDWFFLYHTRLWRKPRLNLKEIYVSALTLSHNHELSVAIRFANVYHRIIDSYLLVDREAETSIKYFALQLFTVPSVSLHIVRSYNIIQRLLDIIAAFFTNQIRDKRIVHPPDVNAEIDVDAFPFKSKRFMPVFSDLRYICHNRSVQELIANNHEYVAQFAQTCQLFMCVHPNKRAVQSHVEYETDAWISVFNVTLSLSRVIKVYGEAYSKAPVKELMHAITVVVRHLQIACTGVDPRQDPTKFPLPRRHDVVFGNKSYTLVDFNVLDGWVSFHHSLHWLLSELFKHVDILSRPSLQTIGFLQPRDFLLAKFSEEDLLTIFDYPLRVLAMIAQIRTGLWVRNGFPIRGQLLHYRDFVLRELCYDQDIFMLQCTFTVIDPEKVLVTVLDRFQLRGYFHGAILHEQYEGPHLYSMVEEMLYVIITVLTENANATKMTLRDSIRREIIHALAVGPCAFTDLVKRLAERMVDDVSFEHVLHEVTNFKSPESIADTGVYELKDECFDEVNPFFYHYTRNKREEVENVLRKRIQKKTGVVDSVLVPSPNGVKEGPFTVLASTYESGVLLQIMFYAIYNVIAISDANASTPASAEATLDQALHIVMLALVERPRVFTGISIFRAFEEGKTIIDLLCSLEQNIKFKSCKARVNWILDRYNEYIPLEIQARRLVLDSAEGQTGGTAEDAKKRAARARQDAIMKQMKAQQHSFAHNFDGMDEEEDMEDANAAPAHVSHGTCIVCQEELSDTRSFGALGFIQPTRLIRRHPDGNHGYLNEALNTPISLDRQEETVVEPFPPQSALLAKGKPNVQLDGFPAVYNRFGLNASICSHMMHLECFSTYNSSSRHRLRAQAQRNHPENAARKEYICPLCKSLGNIILPFALPSAAPLNTTNFPDWIRAAGINILKSKPDPQLDHLQSKAGTGEFVFWAAQDSGHKTATHSDETGAALDLHKMADTVILSTRLFSMQTRHLRDRPEPEPGERGAGLYLPEDLVVTSIAAIEIAQRGVGAPGSTILNALTESQARLIRGLVGVLTKTASLQFRGRPDEGRDAVRQAIIKRLLPEWSRTSLTSFSFPLLLRNPLTLLVEAAAVSPEILRHILVLTYYACLARTVIGLVYILNKIRPGQTATVSHRTHEDLFGDIRVFFISVVRHSPVFEHTAEVVFEALGDARVEKLMYTFTLPFLRQAAILCHSVLPTAFPLPDHVDNAVCEYRRLMGMLGIPALSDLPNQDTIQNALSGWCAHYGHSHAAAQLNCGVYLDYPSTYQVARLPAILDNLFGDDERVLTCPRCKTAPNDAAICLICGTIVCLQSHCCIDTSDGRVHGECNMHTRECGGAIGMYFLVKRCTVLYLYAGNGSFGLSPYLDIHGEVDISMRRGRRQYLHHARWEEVRKIWLSHGIPTLIARKLESAIDSGGWETF